MNLFFIERYIQKVKKEDIYNYANNQGINLTPSELNTLYHYLKNYYRPFLTNPSTRPKILSELKSQVTPATANKLDELYDLYKNKL
ncbi:MAG: DUF2624 family protein [Bacilli bacterium]|nr:DUF2624 family protein [Bacilli bacterium]